MSREKTNMELQITQDWWANEQTWFWNRFAGFAALEAVTIYVAGTSTEKLLLFFWFCLAGLCLSAAWWLVQTASLFYVNRAKIRYKRALKCAGIEPYASYRYTSSTGIVFNLSWFSILAWPLWAAGMALYKRDQLSCWAYLIIGVSLLAFGGALIWSIRRRATMKAAIAQLSAPSTESSKSLPPSEDGP